MKQRIVQVPDAAWLMGILWIGLALRLPLLGEQSLWFDEAYSWLFMAATDLRAGLEMSLASFVHPPLYYILGRPFTLLGDTEWWLRFPSVLTSVLAISAIYIVGREVAGRRSGLLAAILLAVNPFHVWFAREVRNYSLAALLTLCVAYFWIRILRGKRQWFGLTLCSGLSFFTHYFCLLLPMAQFLFFLLNFRRRYRLLRKWMLSMAIAFVPTFLWMVALFTQEEKMMGIGWIPTPRPWTPLLTLWNWSLLTKVEWTLLDTISLPFFAAALILGLRRSKHRQWLLLWLGVPILFVMLVSWLLGRNFYVDRYFIVSLPAYLLLLTVGVHHVRPAWLQTGLVVALLFASILSTTRIWSDQEMNKEDWQSAMALVTEGRQPEDLIVMHQAEDIVPARYYYPQSLEPWAYVDSAQATGLWNAIMAEYAPSRLWLVYRNANVSAHLVTQALPFDIYSQADPHTRAWLAAHRSQVVAEHILAGITVLVMEFQ